MSNVIYGDNLYNREVKERFLGQYNEDYFHFYGKMFKISYFIEEQLKKDLYEFNIDEIKRVLQLANPSTLGSSRQNGMSVKKYIRWSIQEGYRSSSINPLDSVMGSWYHQFVNKDIQTIFSESEIEEIIRSLNNYQDIAIVQAIFEGVYGTGYSELLNLKINDVNSPVENSVRLVDDSTGRVRYISLSDRCIEYLIKAYNEERYLKNNGELSENIRSPYLDLRESEYIIKVANTRRSVVPRANDPDRADKFTVLRRFRTIKNLFDLPYFTAQNVRYSGMLKMAKDIYIEKGNLETEDYFKIGERFGFYKTLVIGGREQYGYYRHKDSFLNVEKIKEVYPDL